MLFASLFAAIALLAPAHAISPADFTGTFYLKIGDKFLLNVENVGITLSDTQGTLYNSYMSNNSVGYGQVYQDLNTTSGTWFLAYTNGILGESQSQTVWLPMPHDSTKDTIENNVEFADPLDGVYICDPSVGAYPMQVQKDCARAVFNPVRVA